MAKPIEPKKRDPRGGLGLGLRFALFSALLVVASVAVAVGVTHWIGSVVCFQEVSADLERAVNVQSKAGQDLLEQLYLRSLTVSDNPNFVAYVAEAMETNSPLSLIDQLDERQRDLGFTFAIVLDPDGLVIARTDQQGGDDDLSDEAIYRVPVESGEYVSEGIWANGDKLYHSVLVPLGISGLLEGFLITAYEVDDETAGDLQKLTGTEVTFLALPGAGQAVPVGTSLSANGSEMLRSMAAESIDFASEDGSVSEMELDRGRWLVKSVPVRDVSGEIVGALVNLGSIDQAFAPFNRINRTMIWAGLGVLAIALALSFLLPRRLLEPLRRLARASAAAASGDYTQSVRGQDRNDEIGLLARAFDHLLAELREKRDMQVYLTELTRTLPDQDAEASDEVPASRKTVTLLGIELRGWYGEKPDATRPQEIMGRLSGDLRHLTRAVLQQGGAIETAGGSRILASFEGAVRSERALGAAAKVLSLPLDFSVAVAMAAGSTVSGTITWHNKPSYTVAGPTLDLLEALLRVSPDSTLLVAESCHDDVREPMKLANLNPKNHRSSVSDEMFWALDRAQAARLDIPELDATVDLSTLRETAIQTGGRTGAVTLGVLGPGSVLAERFEILTQLGAGGMGVVYKARDRKLDELVALKMLRHDVFDEPSGLDRLKDELRLARKIAHPNVLRTFDFGEADGFPFISMEFVRGVTLKRLLEESGRLPLSAGLHMARQLCRGLAAAHSQGVLHRDIKPENVILDPTGNLKLMDFGIAQPIRGKTQSTQDTGGLVGTPFYLAPEQLQGKEPDVRADIYACGVAFYEIFTGVLPFPRDKNLMQLLQHKLQEDPPPPSVHWPEIPKDLERIIQRSLARDRDDRFDVVDSLLTDLETLRA
ncbi:MAG: protein kinase [Thermoanaerobaculia bacterium]|nr:protein kinase [Thermoanaerobaculia bacterium]